MRDSVVEATGESGYKYATPQQLSTAVHTITQELRGTVQACRHRGIVHVSHNNLLFFELSDVKQLKGELDQELQEKTRNEANLSSKLEEMTQVCMYWYVCVCVCVCV